MKEDNRLKINGFKRPALAASAEAKWRWENIRRLEVLLLLSILICAPACKDKSSPPPIVANDDRATALCQSQILLNVLANDQGEGLELTGFSQAGGAMIVDNGFGVLLIDGIGDKSFSFTYTIVDQHGQTATANVFIDVELRELKANDDSFFTEKGSPLDGNILANDIGDELRFSLNNPAPTASGSLAFESNGQFSFLPEENFCGLVQLTYSLTDICGQTDEARLSIAVTGAPPEIICPTNLVLDCKADIAPSVTGEVTAIDDCDPNPTISFSDLIEGDSCAFIISRNWIVRDFEGNESTCLQIIEIKDEKAPVLACPPDIQINFNGDISPEVSGWAEVADNCASVENIALNFEDDTGGLTGCSGTGLVLRSWSAVDACGNTDNCVQQLIVIDEEPPLLICPFPFFINKLEEADPERTGRATATDNTSNIDNIVITFSDDVDGLTACNGSGILRRTWTATDVCGNVGFCMQEIIVEDTEAPVISCPPEIEVNCGEAADLSITGQATATDDNNAPEEIELSFSDNEDGLNGCAGTLIRTWTAIDSCGNAASCNQTIRIRPADNGQLVPNTPLQAQIIKRGYIHPYSIGLPIYLWTHFRGMEASFSLQRTIEFDIKLRRQSRYLITGQKKLTFGAGVQYRRLFVDDVLLSFNRETQRTFVDGRLGKWATFLSGGLRLRAAPNVMFQLEGRVFPFINRKEVGFGFLFEPEHFGNRAKPSNDQ